jgi:hypothetical protein
MLIMPQHVAFADNSRLARNKTPKPRITKRVKDAIDAIVERGIAYNEAAAESGLTTRTMRLALERPHVLAYLRQQLKVLRDARGPRNFHRLCAIADAADNLPAVHAIRALELLSEEATVRRSDIPTPGVVLNIIHASSPARSIDVTPAPVRIIDAGE